MAGLLLLGFLFGMRHAPDADHVTAVAALATRTQGSVLHTKTRCRMGPQAGCDTLCVRRRRAADGQRHTEAPGFGTGVRGGGSRWSSWPRMS